MEAIRFFDPSRGQFSTLAWHCIKHQILKEFNKDKIKFETLNEWETVYNNTVPNLSEAVPELSDLENRVWALYILHHKYSEIARLLDMKVNHVYLIIKSIREKINK